MKIPWGIFNNEKKRKVGTEYLELEFVGSIDRRPNKISNMLNIVYLNVANTIKGANINLWYLYFPVHE